MELFKPTMNIDFIGKIKWALLFSLALMVMSGISLLVKGGPRYGLDFEGGMGNLMEALNYDHERTKRRMEAYRKMAMAKLANDSAIEYFADIFPRKSSAKTEMEEVVSDLLAGPSKKERTDTAEFLLSRPAESVLSVYETSKTVNRGTGFGAPSMRSRNT